MAVQRSGLSITTAEDMASTPGQGTKIPHAEGSSQKKREKVSTNSSSHQLNLTFKANIMLPASGRFF